MNFYATIARPHKRWGLLFTLLVALSVGLPLPSAQAASSPQTFALEVPPGQWKTIRLQHLPKDVLLTLAVKSDGLLTVGFLDAQDHRQFPNIARPLFLGHIEATLGFSVTIPQQGDYYVLLDNRNGTRARQVYLTAKAALGGDAARALLNAQLEKVERQLHTLVQKLNQTFAFNPVPIQVKACDRPKPFDREGRDGSLTLCLQYAQQLMQTFQDKTQASDALIYSMFQEMARLCQAQWDLDSSDPASRLDELTTVLMLTFRLDANVRAYAQTMINQPALSSSLENLFHDPFHPLTAERAERVLKWATDPDLVRNWQPRLVPHMQTKMLDQLKDHPQPWSDRQLIEAELAERARTPSNDLPTVRPKGRIKA